MLERVNTPLASKLHEQKLMNCSLHMLSGSARSTAARHNALQRNELDIAIAHGRLILTSWTEKGSRSWKIFAWEWTGEKLMLQASRRMGAERPLIELVPRAAASAIALTVKAARQSALRQLGQTGCSIQSGAKLERAALSPGARRGQPGRYARIVLRQKHQRIAVTGSVASSRASDADAFLSAALMWFKRVSERARPPYIQQLWLAVESELVKPLIQRVALLRPACERRSLFTKLISSSKRDEAG